MCQWSSGGKTLWGAAISTSSGKAERGRVKTMTASRCEREFERKKTEERDTQEKEGQTELASLSKWPYSVLE